MSGASFGFPANGSYGNGGWAPTPSHFSPDERRCEEIDSDSEEQTQQQDPLIQSTNVPVHHITMENGAISVNGYQTPQQAHVPGVVTPIGSSSVRSPSVHSMSLRSHTPRSASFAPAQSPFGHVSWTPETLAIQPVPMLSASHQTMPNQHDAHALQSPHSAASVVHANAFAQIPHDMQVWQQYPSPYDTWRSMRQPGQTAISQNTDTKDDKASDEHLLEAQMLYMHRWELEVARDQYNIMQREQDRKYRNA